MKREDIFRAIGELDSEFLEQCEAPAAPRRKLWLIPLVAALIAALCATAAAGGLGRVSHGEVAEVTANNHYSIGAYSFSQESQELEVFVDLQLENLAPDYVHQLYLPTICEDLEVTGLQRDGASLDPGAEQMTRFLISWNHPDYKFKQNITFEQRTIRYWRQSEQKDTVPDYLPGTDVESKMLRWDDHEAFLVTIGPSKDDLSQSHRLYWTDGYYVFILRCPYGIGEEWMRAAVESVARVDTLQDIQKELAQRVEEGQEEMWEDLKRVANSSPEIFTKQFHPVSGHVERLENGMPKLSLEPTDTTGAPEKVEMMIFPFVAEEKDFVFHSDCIPTFVEAPEGVTKGVACYYSVNWAYELGGRVEYWQIARGASLHYTNHSYAPADSVQVETVTIGNYELLQVTCEEDQRQTIMGKELYWMDDDYRYILICPLAMTDAEILEILDSLDRI